MKYKHVVVRSILDKVYNRLAESVRCPTIGD